MYVLVPCLLRDSENDLSVLIGMSHMIVMLLFLLYITVSGLCSYHLSVISIS